MSHANSAKKSTCDSDPGHVRPKSSFETFKASTRFLYAEQDLRHGSFAYGLCKICDSTIGFEFKGPLPSIPMIW
jgi:hypothetical protein